MLLIKNGCIHDGLGNVFENTDIIIESGIIKDIGKSLRCPNAIVKDASGKDIFPGFIDTINSYGCVIGSQSDCAELTNPINPQMNIVYAFDQDGMNFQELYRCGITSSGISPLPTNVIAGQTAVFKTFGKSPYKMLVKEKAAMIASITSDVNKVFGVMHQSPMTKMATIALLIDTLKKASTYNKANGYDPVSESLVPVIEGNIPLFINCVTKAEMEAVLITLEPFNNIKIVITGAYDLTKDDAIVHNKNISYIMGDLISSMNNPSISNVKYSDIIELMKNGTQIAIGSYGNSYTSSKYSLLWNAITWYKNGLNAEEVLMRITSVPAKLLGVNDKIGSIEIGKHADLSIWTANPIKSYTASIDAVYIEGENMLLKERRTSCW